MGYQVWQRSAGLLLFHYFPHSAWRFLFIEIPIVEVKQSHDYQGGRDNQWELVGNEISYVGLVDKFGGKGCVCRAGALVEQRCGGNDG